MRAGRKVLKGLLLVLLVVVVAVAGLIGYLSLTEYSPADVEQIVAKAGARKDIPAVGEKLTLVSMNVGYGGLGRNQNFFMDGGAMVRPDSQKEVEENLAGIASVLVSQQADVYLLQEVDVNSNRTYGIDEAGYFEHALSMGTAFAYNYKCEFVPIPWPMIGKVESGLQTLSNLSVKEATRKSLPVPFSWPVRIANMKRCLLIERIPVEGRDTELVMINLHLEAFDDGEGKKAQTAVLKQILQAEYSKGNFIIAGGDFNQRFPDASKYLATEGGFWQPGQLTEGDLPTGFSFVYDESAPTCRSVHANYDGDRENWPFYVIDGFIVSDNIKVNHIETVDLNFENSDHQPIRLEFTLVDADS